MSESFISIGSFMEQRILGIDLSATGRWYYFLIKIIQLVVSWRTYHLVLMVAVIFTGGNLKKRTFLKILNYCNLRVGLLFKSNLRTHQDQQLFTAVWEERGCFLSAYHQQDIQKGFSVAIPLVQSLTPVEIMYRYLNNPFPIIKGLDNHL